VEGGRWEGEAGAVRALEGERRRPLSREEEEVVRTGLEVLAKVDGEGVREQSGEIEKLVDALRRAGDLSEGADLPELVPLDAVDFVARGLS